MTTSKAGTASRCALVTAAATTTAFPADAQGYDHMGLWNGMWNGGWGWGHMVVGSFMMLLFWGGLIALATLLVRGFAGEGRRDQMAPPPRAAALDLLEERFARGEIGREEFEERRRVLLASRADAERKAR